MTTFTSPVRSIEDIYPLSPMQQGMLFHSLLNPGTGQYTEQLSTSLIGPFNMDAFRQSWQEVLNRHSILRSSFVWEDIEEPLQIVHKQVDLPLTYEDWSLDNSNDIRNKFEILLERDRVAPFDLAQSPLMRFYVIRISTENHSFIWSHHHILLDGWSTPILFNEVFTYYDNFSKNILVDLPQPQPFRNYIGWLKKQDLQKAEDHWRTYLNGFTTSTPLIVDNIPDDPEEEEENKPGDDHPLIEASLSLQSTLKLRDFSKQHGITLNTLMQGAWAILLNRYSGEEDIIFGATVSGRPPELSGSEKMVGMFINTLPVRINFKRGGILLDSLIQLQKQNVANSLFEYTPLFQIQAWSQIPPGFSLFDSILIFENYPVEPALLEHRGTLSIQNIRHSSSTNYPLTIVASVSQVFNIHASYDANRIHKDVAERMLHHLTFILENIPDNSLMPIEKISILKEDERALVIEYFNNTKVENGFDGCIYQLLEHQANKNPDVIAIKSVEGDLTYQAFNKKVNQLANYLISIGVGPETRVGLCLRRSVAMLIGIYGIMKAGGVYVPMDPGLPIARMSYTIEDSGIKVLLTQESILPFLPDSDGLKICLDRDWEAISVFPEDNPLIGVKPENAVYIIYTSGSTGIPKGVVVEHRSLTNIAINAAKVFGIGIGTRMLQIMSISFDAAGEEIHPTIISGGTLVLSNSDIEMTGYSILQFCQENKVNIIHLPTAIWHQIVLDVEGRSLKIPESISVLIVGGETPSVDRLNAWIQASINDFKFINAYGPTETTITTTYYELNCSKRINIPASSIPIGKPIANVFTYVLDKWNQPTPVGIPGEMFIGGMGVARGYQNQPELTNQRYGKGFNGDTLYKTGDRVIWLSNGNLQFLGRLDEQVKWRGYRIELGEIENKIIQYPGIRETIVVLREDHESDPRLVAYIVPNEPGSVDLSNLKSHIKQNLPEYMNPSHYVFLEKLPLTTTGKIDKKSLPLPELFHSSEKSSYFPPKNATEEILAGIFADVLKVKEVSIIDNFFELGGHSLLATQLVSRIRSTFKVEIPLQTLFDSPTVNDLTKIINKKENYFDIPGIEIVTIDRDKEIPLSFSQQRLWFLDQLDPDNLFYNISTVVRLKGKFDISILEKCINSVIKRHEILRTVFLSKDGKAFQSIKNDLSLHIDIIDLVNIHDNSREFTCDKILADEIRKPFSLTEGPLIRASLIKLSAGEAIIVLIIHHIISDGWSMNLLIKELVSFYQENYYNLPSSLPDLPVQYADYATWQRNWIKGDILEKQLKYWKEKLTGISPLLDLPTDFPRPAIKTSNGDSRNFWISIETTEKISGLCRQNGVTMYMFLLASFKILLYRYSGQNDIVVGSAMANRTHSEIENLIGFFVNTLVFRTDLSGDPIFADLLSRVRETAIGAYAHQDLPFEMLVDALQPERNLSYTPIFQVGFDVQTTQIGETKIQDLVISPVQIQSKSAEFDLLLSITHTSEGLIGSLEFNTDLFLPETIERMLANYQTLLEDIIRNPDKPISTLKILTTSERQTLLHTWNQTKSDTRYNQCIHQKFEAWVSINKDHPALIFENQAINYGSLNQFSNKLARYLKGKGVGPEKIVGVFTERSFEMVIGILGILKAGGAYLPLDPNYPEDRLSFMISDVTNSQPENGIIILTQKRLLTRIPNLRCEVIILDEESGDYLKENGENLECSSRPESLAYVIYTSGSTGRPKGTLLNHRGLCNLCEAQKRIFELSPTDKILQFSPLSFDASVWETFMALGNGATLCLAKQDVLASGIDLIKLIRDQEISIVTLPPSVLAVLPEEQVPSLRIVISAGEACSKEYVDKWAKSRKFFDAYGPTETTVCATIALCEVGDPREPSIGRPLPNFQIYIVDQFMQPVPIGVPGELLIGGVGLARGYLNRPEMTSEKFIPNPFSLGSRLYRSGDLARYRPDGNIEYLGRIDQQVKVRGFRIELGEIENVLRQIQGINDSVVIIHEEKTGDKRIAAYVVAEDSNELKDVSILKSKLKELLPEYMIPTYITFLEKFPISPSGKVDRKSLPLPEKGRIELVNEYIPPHTEIEKQLVDLCIFLLGVEKVGIKDNFFELGGHSLLATQLISRIRDIYGIEIPLRSLFEHPTIFELSLEIEKVSSNLDIQKAPTIKAIPREGRRMKRGDLE